MSIPEPDVGSSVMSEVDADVVCRFLLCEIVRHPTQYHAPHPRLLLLPEATVSASRGVLLGSFIRLMM